jgi:glycine cleavage system protein P-like pyridoxal-binding family
VGESKSKAELDRFCYALISIYRGNSRNRDREADIEGNVLKRAAHGSRFGWRTPGTGTDSRESAAYPAAMDGRAQVLAGDRTN